MGKTAFSLLFHRWYTSYPFKRKTFLQQIPLNSPQTSGENESALLWELTSDAQMLHESYWSGISLMCFFSSLPRTQFKIIWQSLIDFPLFSEIGRKSTTEWMAGGQGQPAAKGVAESKLCAPSLKLPSQLPCPVHGTSEDRRGPERWCLILRATAGDSPDKENSMRMVSGTRFVKAAPCIAAFMPALLFWVSPSSTTELAPFAAPQGCSSPLQPTQLSDLP